MVLAYCSPDDEDEDEDEDDKEKDVTRITHGHKSQPSTSSTTSSQPTGGISRRQNNLRPELRLIDLDSKKEVSGDSLTVSRYERLTAGDYHLGILPPRNAAANVSSRGALGALAGIGTDVWHAAINPKSLFNSAASASARSSGDDASSVAKTGSIVGPMRPGLGRSPSVHPGLIKPGAKIFIHSPYDCILGTKRDLSDHLYWLIERQKYEQAWGLLNDNPEILSGPDAISERPSTPTKAQHGEDGRDDESVAESSYRGSHSSAEKEKRRIGDLWIQSLVEEGNWAEAARVCSQVINTSDRWEKWVWNFAEAKKFDEITDFIPTEPTTPPISPAVYEVVLGHYLQTDKPRFKELLDRWSLDFFNINTITTALENQLNFRDVREDSIEDGEKGRDWRIVLEALARLDEANGRHREALKCYIKLHDADSTFRLIRDSHLTEYVADDIPSFIGLRVAPERLTQMTEKDLEEATSEAITLLVDEAHANGLVQPNVVVEQLLAQELHLYLYFYLRGLWKGTGLDEHAGGNKDRLAMDSQDLVDDFADLAVHLFAMYDRELLMDFLKTSTSYGLEKVCGLIVGPSTCSLLIPSRPCKNVKCSTTTTSSSTSTPRPAR
jgi:vacuolar protein sorting-associated protein 41